MLKKIIASDNAVKSLFDHFRNVGICAAIFSAAIWLYKNPSSGFLDHINTASSVALTLLGLVLFVINERHGQRKLDEAGIPRRWHFVAMCIYSLSLFPLLAALVMVST